MLASRHSQTILMQSNACRDALVPFSANVRKVFAVLAASTGGGKTASTVDTAIASREPV
jgi:hypothetical protein